MRVVEPCIIVSIAGTEFQPRAQSPRARSVCLAHATRKNSFGITTFNIRAASATLNPELHKRLTSRAGTSWGTPEFRPTCGRRKRVGGGLKHRAEDHVINVRIHRSRSVRAFQRAPRSRARWWRKSLHSAKGVFAWQQDVHGWSS